MARYINSVPQILDGNGNPIVGAKKYMFEPGSSTLKTIYSDSALSLATVNPVVSDADGRFPSFFLDGTYKEVQEDENGVTLWTRDPVGVEAVGEWTLWDAGTTYSIPQIVLGSDDEYYRSLVDSNIGNDPTSSPASWEQLYLGRIWNANVTYSITDTVYGSDGYLYKSQINSNLNNDPTTDFVNWWPGSPDHFAITAAGTNTYTATYGETAYKTGRDYYITFTNASTASAPTLNLDSLGAKTIRRDGGDALLSGDIPANHEAILRYDGTQFILLNPAVQRKYLQRVDATPYTTYSSTTTVMPQDDTIPQNTEGTEYITVSITPMSATNVLIIRANAGMLAGSGSGTLQGMALFQDSTANALAASGQANTADYGSNLTIDYKMVAGTTSSTTFKIRIGPGAAGTTYINGNAGIGRHFGGVIALTLSVEEIEP